MSMWIVAAAALSGVLAYLFVKPLFEPALGGVVVLSEQDSLRSLLDTKERLLRSLKDLELDHSTGKVSDEDYQGARRDLSLEVGRVLSEIQSHGGR